MVKQVIIGGNIAMEVGPGKFRVMPDGPVHDLNDDLLTAMQKVAQVASEARYDERKKIKDAIDRLVT